MNRLEVVFLLVDYLFLEHSRSRSKSEELVGNLGRLCIMLFLYVIDRSRSRVRINGTFLANLLRDYSEIRIRQWRFLFRHARNAKLARRRRIDLVRS